MNGGNSTLRKDASMNSLNARLGNLDIANDAEDGFQEVVSKKSRNSVSFAPTYSPRNLNANLASNARSRIPPPLQSSQNSSNTAYRGPRGQASSRAARGNWREPQSAPSIAASYTMDIEEAFKQWGVNVARAVTGQTSTSVSAHHPKVGTCNANMHHALIHPGDIAWAPWVVSCLDAAALIKDNPKSQDNFAWAVSTGPITAKMKPMIISGIYKEHLICYPIHSAGGNGLDRKHDYQKSLSVRLYKEKEAVPREYGIHYLRANNRFDVKDNSYVDLARPYVLELKCPLRMEGGLTQSSAKRLKALVMPYFEQGFQKVNERGPHHRPTLPAAGLNSPRLQ